MIKLKLYAIKTPETDSYDSFIYWFAESKTKAWHNFFNDNIHKLPIYDAIRAYEAIGYKCVEINGEYEE
jgi:hypothetical protein